MATKAQTRYAAEQALRALISETGIRWAGTYGHPYPNKPIVRYHAVLSVETMPNHQYDWQMARYLDEIAKLPVSAIAEHGLEGLRTYGHSAPSTTHTYVMTACGIENLGYSEGDRLSDVRELTDVGEDRATDAPICKRCAKIVGIEGES